MVLLTVLVSAQGKFTARVVDAETGNPVEGVQVCNLQGNVLNVTNAEGIFVISAYKKGDALVLKHITYQETQVTLRMSGSVITMSPLVYEISDVVITGAKAETNRDNVPLTVTTVHQSDIEASGESALLPVVSEMVPGVFVTEKGVTGFGLAGNAAGQMSVRGIGGSPNTQVLMLIDGHPQYMGIMGHTLPDAYVASDAERVEIIRGPASILYGSNAMGGVVNIITRKQEYDGLSFKGKLGCGSFNTMKAMAGVGFKREKFNVYVSVNHDETDGHRTNSDFMINNGYVKIGYDINQHVKTFGDVSIAKFKTTDPGPEGTADTTYIYNPHWIDIMRGEASVTLENEYGKTSGALKVFHNFGEHKIYDGFHSVDIHSGAMLYQSLEILKGNRLTAGVDYSIFGGIAENTIAMKGEGIVFSDTMQSSAGVYLIDQQELFEKLTLNAGVRLENHSVYGSEIVPQGGVSWKPFKKTTVKSVVGKGFRNPTIRELYLWAPANEELQPERMISYEIGWLQQVNDKINTELIVYYMEGDNLIKTLFINGAPKNMNTGEFVHKGIELAVNYRIIKNLRLRTNYSYLDMDVPQLAAPGHQLYAGVDYSLKKFRFHVNTQYIGDLYTNVTGGQEAKESYVMLNARLSYAATGFLSVYLAGNNLLDESYMINYGYTMPGMNFMGGLNFNLNMPDKK